MTNLSRTSKDAATWNHLEEHDKQPVSGLYPVQLLTNRPAGAGMLAVVAFFVSGGFPAK